MPSRLEDIVYIHTKLYVYIFIYSYSYVIFHDFIKNGERALCFNFECDFPQTEILLKPSLSVTIIYTKNSFWKCVEADVA